MTPSRLTLAAVGDVFLSRPAFNGERAFEPGFGEVVALLRRAAMTFGNFELPLSERGWPAHKMITIRTSPAVAADVQRMGFNIVSLANNHVGDYGPDALLDTAAALERACVATVGAGATLEAALAPVVLERDGMRVGFLAWSTLLPANAAATPERPGIAPLKVRTAYEVDPIYVTEEPTAPPTVRTWVDPAALAQAEGQVREVRSSVDYLVVSVHWGAGIGEGLAEFQRPLGHALVEAGADLVVGNHPHAVHGVEIYHGRPILYSPGLFLEQVPREGASDEILALYDLLSPDSYVALVDIVDGETAQLRLVPTSSETDGLPRLARGAELHRIHERLVNLSRALDTEVPAVGGDLLVPLLPGPAGEGIRQLDAPPGVRR